MNNSRAMLYESLVRLSLLFIFMITLVVGTVGLVSVCSMLIETKMPTLEFVTRDLS